MELMCMLLHGNANFNAMLQSTIISDPTTITTANFQQQLHPRGLSKRITIGQSKASREPEIRQVFSNISNPSGFKSDHRHCKSPIWSKQIFHYCNLRRYCE
jgi:hypothetical protein